MTKKIYQALLAQTIPVSKITSFLVQVIGFDPLKHVKINIESV